MVLGCLDCAVQDTKFEEAAKFMVNQDWFFRGRHGVACTEQYCEPTFSAYVWVWFARRSVPEGGADQKLWPWLALSNLGLPSLIVDWHFRDAMRVPSADAEGCGLTCSFDEWCLAALIVPCRMRRFKGKPSSR